MKVILILYMCSFNTGACLPPYEFPVQYNNMYDCLNAGYEESLRKSKEICKEEVIKNGIYIRFACKEKKTKELNT